MARGNFGERLKRERELREVTLEEITSATRIGPRFLEALENEDWEKLPGGVFNRGFVRSVARYLGLDEEGFLAEYDLAHGARVQLAPARPEHRIPSGPKWFPFAVVLGFLILLAAAIYGGLYAWRHYATHDSGSQTQPAEPVKFLPAAKPNPSETNPSTPSAGNGTALSSRELSAMDLSVSVSSVTRVRVETDGEVVFDGDLRPGENRHFPARDHFLITAADAGAVLLELNGQAMPPLGAPGASGTIKLGHENLR
jgi:cytoskeletal protein RodZ